MKTLLIILCIVGGLIGLSAVGLAWRAAMLPVHAVSNVIDTGHGIIDKTINADNAIYNYEWFKQQHEDIIAIENKIEMANLSVTVFEDSAGSTRSTWTFEDKTEDARLRSVYQGLKSQHEDMVAQYNARAKMANRNIFLDGKIPGFIQIGAQFLK